MPARGRDIMFDKVYTLDEIKAMALPVAIRHGVAELYLFGSYARSEATSDSDLDFRIEKGRIRNVLQLGSFLNDMEDTFQKKVDILTTEMLSDDFLSDIHAEEILIYAQRGQ